MSKIKVNEIEKASGTGITVHTGTSFTITDGLAIGSVPTITQAKIDDQAINEAKLQVSNAPTNGYFLSAQSGNTGGLTWAEASSGGVKQLKQTLKTTSFGTSSSSYVDVTGLSVTITPSSASNRILVMCNASLTAENQSGGLGYLKMIRNVGGGSFSELAESTDSGSYTHGHAEIEFNTAYGHVGSIPMNFLYFDHPNTTSAVIYKMSAKTNGSGTMVMGRSGRADTSSQDIKHATQLIAIEIDGGIL